MTVLTEMCQDLRNWFDRGRKKWNGKIVIIGGVMFFDDGNAVTLQNGQYYRIIGSLFNDGVHRVGDAEDVLTDELEFDGAIWEMAIPPDFLSLADEIAAWREKYGNIDSQAMSPYTSESFGGYTYSKGATAGGGSASGGNGSNWQSVFASRLNMWRKI